MELHCTQPFIITCPSSRYDWNTVEKEVEIASHQGLETVKSFIHTSIRFSLTSRLQSCISVIIDIVCDNHYWNCIIKCIDLMAWANHWNLLSFFFFSCPWKKIHVVTSHWNQSQRQFSNKLNDIITISQWDIGKKTSTFCQPDPPLYHWVPQKESW